MYTNKVETLQAHLKATPAYTEPRLLKELAKTTL